MFLGAGVSMGAGMPSWGALLTELATRANMTEEDSTKLKALPYLDQAKIIEMRLGPEDIMKNSIAGLLQSKHFSMAHALLAGLNVQASIDVGHDLDHDGRQRGRLVVADVLNSFYWAPCAL